jgi:hypothetical protein
MELRSVGTGGKLRIVGAGLDPEAIRIHHRCWQEDYCSGAEIAW